MRYYATKDNLARVVPYLQDHLRDFLDFGTAVHEPGGTEVYGWIETDRAAPAAAAEILGLVPAERRGAS